MGFDLLLCAALLAVAGTDAGPILRSLPPPAGLAPVGEVAVYPAERLWDYIDGAAEAYRDYGVVETATVGFGRQDATLPRMTIDLHRMAEPKGALGIFQSERGEKAEDLHLGSGSSWQNGLLLLWRGPYYARIVTEASRETTLACAEALAGILPAGVDSFPVFRVFPDTGRVRAQDTFVARAFLGIRGLDNVWMASYSDTAGIYRLFVTRNRPPLREEDVADHGKIIAMPSQSTPVQLIELEKGRVVILFYKKMSRYLAGYIGSPPRRDRTQTLSHWIDSLPLGR